MSDNVFYNLTSPDYSTDQQEARANPVKQVSGLWMPGIQCEECHQTWAGSRRLYLPVANASIRSRLKPNPITAVKWFALAKQVREAVGVEESFFLWPGDELGTPTYEVTSIRIPDVMHPFPGTLLISESLLNVLKEAQLSGFRPVPVNIVWSKRIKETELSPPNLCILQITGSAERIGTIQRRECNVCGRMVQEVVGSGVNVATWDGSDFFNLNDNPNDIYVTARVCETLKVNETANYTCRPVSI